MKQIKLIEIEIKNFKGIENFELKEIQDITNLHGANGTFKTSLFDAFSWLLFGKNSIGETKFGIKRNDTEGNPIEGLKIEVSAILDINGEHTKIYRSQSETKSGNTQEFKINDVPFKSNEFSKKIDEICSENIFKLITNPLLFNALKWEEKRETLVRIAGELKVDFGDFTEKLKGKDLEGYQRQLTSEVKELKKEMDQIPSRISEVELSLQNYSEKELQELEEKLSKKDIYEKANTKLSNLQRETELFKTKLNNLKEEYKKTKSAESNIKTECPTCSTKLDEKLIQKANEKFDSDKKQRLTSLTNEGTALANDLLERENSIKKGAEFVESLQIDQKDIERYFELKNLSKNNDRLEELKQKESDLAQHFADKEHDLFKINNFVREKMELLETAVNSKFELVEFRLFDHLDKPNCITMVKCKDSIVNYQDANTASKINSGVDIINVLCDYFKVNAPIFIDNRESVSELIETKSQLFNLIVDKKCKKLTVK